MATTTGPSSQEEGKQREKACGDRPSVETALVRLFPQQGHGRRPALGGREREERVIGTPESRSPSEAKDSFASASEGRQESTRNDRASAA